MKEIEVGDVLKPYLEINIQPPSRRFALPSRRVALGALKLYPEISIQPLALLPFPRDDLLLGILK
jgi:hypothetical protein